MEHFGIQEILFICAIVSGVLAFYFLVTFLAKLKSLSLLSAATRLVRLTLLSGICLITAFLSMGLQSYLLLTDEEHIAKVSIDKHGNRQFTVKVVFNDKSRQEFELSGEQLSIEGNIIRWKPWAKFLGFRSAYRLDRIRGRYKAIVDEKNQPPSIYALVEPQSVDLAQWRDQFAALSFLMDVEHGSGSFVSASHPNYNLMITDSGLLLRPTE